MESAAVLRVRSMASSRVVASPAGSVAEIRSAHKGKAMGVRFAVSTRCIGEDWMRWMTAVRRVSSSCFSMISRRDWVSRRLSGS